MALANAAFAEPPDWDEARQAVCDAQCQLGCADAGHFVCAQKACAVVEQDTREHIDCLTACYVGLKSCQDACGARCGKWFDAIGEKEAEEDG